jgi:hypothetical protein
MTAGCVTACDSESARASLVRSPAAGAAWLGGLGGARLPLTGCRRPGPAGAAGGPGHVTALQQSRLVPGSGLLYFLLEHQPVQLGVQTIAQDMGDPGPGRWTEKLEGPARRRGLRATVTVRLRTDREAAGAGGRH